MRAGKRYLMKLVQYVFDVELHRSAGAGTEAPATAIWSSRPVCRLAGLRSHRVLQPASGGAARRGVPRSGRVRVTATGRLK